MQHTTTPTPWAMGPIICFTAFCFIQGSECNTPPLPHHGLWDQLSASQLSALYRALNATHHQSTHHGLWDQLSASQLIQGSECNTPPVPYHGLWDQLSASQLFALYRALNVTHHQSHTMGYGTNYLLHSLYRALNATHHQSHTMGYGTNYLLHSFLLYTGL